MELEVPWPPPNCPFQIEMDSLSVGHGGTGGRSGFIMSREEHRLWCLGCAFWAFKKGTWLVLKTLEFRSRERVRISQSNCHALWFSLVWLGCLHDGPHMDLRCYCFSRLFCLGDIIVFEHWVIPILSSKVSAQVAFRRWSIGLYDNLGWKGPQEAQPAQSRASCEMRPSCSWLHSVKCWRLPGMGSPQPAALFVCCHMKKLFLTFSPNLFYLK